jgi:hypothetical protein
MNKRILHFTMKQPDKKSVCDNLRTRKPKKRVYTTITQWGVSFSYKSLYIIMIELPAEARWAYGWAVEHELAARLPESSDRKYSHRKRGAAWSAKRFS